MQHLQKDSQSSHVTALFADRALCFALQHGATLEDLVYRLTFLDGREPIAVIVNLGSNSDRQSTAVIAVLPA
jgi:hypothetical protein